MRVISPRRLKDFWERHPQAESPLRVWPEVTRTSRWRNFAELRRSFPHADRVTLDDGRRVVIFNVGGNGYRLVAAVHFNTETVFIRAVLTHSAYDEDKWKT